MDAPDLCRWAIANGLIFVNVVPPPTFASVLSGHHAPISRVEFLAADLDTVLGTLDGRLVNGRVTTDRASDTYSGASIEAVTKTNAITLDAATIALLDSLIVSNQPVRVSRGVYVDGAPVLTPLITGIIADPQSSLSSGSVQFAIASRLSIARRQFSGPTTIAADLSGKTAIRQLLELGGLGTSDALYDLDDGGFVVAVARTFDTNDEILGSAVKWAFDMACELSVTGSGVVRMRPFVDLSATTPAWDFAPGQVRTLLDLGRQQKSRQLYNRQTVYGRGPDGYSVMGEAKVTNPASPLYWRPDFDLPAPPYTSADLSTATACEAVAARLLFENNTLEETLAADVVPVPLISAGDVVSFSVAGLGHFLLDSTSMPIYKGAMRIQTRRVVSTA